MLRLALCTSCEAAEVGAKAVARCCVAKSDRLLASLSLAQSGGAQRAAGGRGARRRDARVGRAARSRDAGLRDARADADGREATDRCAAFFDRAKIQAHPEWWHVTLFGWPISPRCWKYIPIKQVFEAGHIHFQNRKFHDELEAS